MNPTNPNLTDPRIRGLIGLLLICASLALIAVAISTFGGLGKGPENISTIPTIAVTGQGDATVVPNIAEFSFTVDKTAATVADAQTAASTLANQAIAAVKQAGVADTDIKTTNYSINPHYTYSSSPTICPLNGCPPVRQVADGYEVSQTIDVQVENTATVGSLLQTIGQMGVTNVGGINFTTKDKNAGQDQARAAAIADAESKAQLLASQLGVRLGKVVNFQESGNYPGPIMYATASVAKAADSVTPSIPTGQNTVTENVTVTYEIR